MSKFDKDQLGSRMKSYEKLVDLKLDSRTPIIIRIDGNKFSRLTKSLTKPCYSFLNLMAKAMFRTANDIEGCIFGYTQSDEVTLVLKNDQSENSQPWFGNRIQKIASISASSMTMNMFREYLSLDVDNSLRKQLGENPRFTFDSRVWTVPDEMEMFNSLYFRQLDCIKNAISMVVYYRLSEKIGRKKAMKIIHGKGKTERLGILEDICGIKFHKDYPIMFQRGVCAYHKEVILSSKNLDGSLGATIKIPQTITRNKMILDFNTPDFLQERDFIINLYK